MLSEPPELLLTFACALMRPICNFIRKYGDLAFFEFRDRIERGDTDTDLAKWLKIPRQNVGRYRKMFFRVSVTFHDHVLDELRDMMAIRGHQSERISKEIEAHNVIQTKVDEQRRLVTADADSQ